MAKIISFINQKGGVAKTTSAVNVAAWLGEFGNRVLLVDMDPQGSASKGYGIDRNSLKYTVKDILLDLDLPVETAILKTDATNVSIIPANIALSEAEFALMSATKREERLVSALKTVANKYDYIVIDSPPSLSVLTINAMSASDYVFIPIQASYYSFDGVAQLLKTFATVRRLINDRIVIGGVFITVADLRENITKLSIEQAKEFFGDATLNTVIRRNVKVVESPGEGKPVIYTSPNSYGAEDYKNLTLEIIARCEGNA